MYKLSHLVDDRWEQHSYKPAFSIGSVGGVSRVAAGVPAGDPTPFERLVLGLEAPYFLLYVLHTPRGEAQAGRYQSPELSSAQIHEFIQRFGAYLSSDARFDLWAHSPSERATVVWDRHNQLFAYGPLDRFGSQLSSLGFEQAEWESAASHPHQHHYRAENDADAKAILVWCEWTCAPLRPEDEQ